MDHARNFFVLIALAGIWCGPAVAAQSKQAPAPTTWVASWGTSQQIPEPQNSLLPEDLTDATVRQIVHLSLGGPAVRVHLSNGFGTETLHITSVHIARPVSPSSPAIDAVSDRPLMFSGSPEAIIPPGAELVSDPVNFPVGPLSDIAITFHLQSPPARETGHPGSRATSYYVHGDLAGSAVLSEPKHVDHWYQLSEVDVEAPADAATV